jgi:transcriptional regulator with XRE-family HTH domain
MINGMQCRLARVALNWSLLDLARESGTHANTLHKFETGSDPRASTLRTLERVFVAEGFEFPDDLSIRFPARVQRVREPAIAA